MGRTEAGFKDNGGRSILRACPERGPRGVEGWTEPNSFFAEFFRTFGRTFLFFIALTELSLYSTQFSAQTLETDPKPLQVTYIANEGGLISAGSDQVLIDGLFRKGVPGYAKIPNDVLLKLESASPPFDNIDLVLVTHLHADHFDPLSVGAYLRNNSESRLVAGSDVVNLLESSTSAYEGIRDQLSSIEADWQDSVELSYKKIKLKALRIPQGNCVNRVFGTA